MISIHSKYGLASKHASLAAGVSISSCWGVASPSSPLNSALYLDFPSCCAIGTSTVSESTLLMN